MKTIVLLTRLYGQYKNRMTQTVKSNILSLIEELDVRLARFVVDKRGHIVIGIDGQDAEFAINYLTKEYGASIPLGRVREGKTFRGSLVDVGKVGYGALWLVRAQR